MPATAHATDALSPLDGRYAAKLAAVRELFSEAGLMRERVRVECAWLLALAEGPAAAALAALPRARARLARSASPPIRARPTCAAIKRIESRTKHDVKAVEYWIRGELEARGASAAQLEWVHFGCTSEDINNLAYALMLKTRARQRAAADARRHRRACSMRSRGATRRSACWRARTGRRRRPPPSARSSPMWPRASSGSATASRASTSSAR